MMVTCLVKTARISLPMRESARHLPCAWTEMRSTSPSYSGSRLYRIPTCREIIPELIEIGVDILNPVQPECMDPAEIKRQYGDRLSFSGTIGTQSTMPFGTPREVEATIRKRIETVGVGGGLLLAPTHVLEPDVSWENILAFLEAVDRWGWYK